MYYWRTEKNAVYFIFTVVINDFFSSGEAAGSPVPLSCALYEDVIPFVSENNDFYLYLQ
jgi:hypothetical protein